MDKKYCSSVELEFEFDEIVKDVDVTDRDDFVPCYKQTILHDVYWDYEVNYNVRDIAHFFYKKVGIEPYETKRDIDKKIELFEEMLIWLVDEYSSDLVDDFGSIDEFRDYLYDVYYDDAFEDCKNN